MRGARLPTLKITCLCVWGGVLVDGEVISFTGDIGSHVGFGRT